MGVNAEKLAQDLTDNFQDIVSLNACVCHDIANSL